MPILKELLTFEYESEHESEHVFEHNLLVKKKFSSPKIYTANGDLKKRWYVYFSFRNPKTGKLQRMKNIYGTVHHYKTKEERLTVLSIYRRKLVFLLNKGFDPFENNSELYLQKIKKQEKAIVKELPIEVSKTALEPAQLLMNLNEAFDFGLKQKEKILSPSSKRGYANHSKNFLKWMQQNKQEVKTIDQLQKKDVIEFLNSVLERTSARTRNNFRTDLSSLMQVLEDNEIIPNNFIKKINVLKSIPERNQTYTKEVQEEIFQYLEKKDPTLLLYIKFISYAFLRPIEVSRLKIGDINLIGKNIKFKAKNSPHKTKILPEILEDDLPDMKVLDKELALFTPEGIGGEWETTPENRRNYFTKRFKKVVKDHFKLGANFGLYSFRHTCITKVYREFRKTASPFESKSRLMLITGHSSMTALEKYLRDMDAELPEDFSDLLRN